MPATHVGGTRGPLGRPLHDIVSFAMLVHNSEPEQHNAIRISHTPTRPSLAISSDLFRSNVPLRLASEICKELPSRVRASEAHRTFWTRTVWTDASSMKSFMLSGVHRQVMPSLLVCGATRLPLPIGFRIRWNLRRGKEVHRRLQHDGRRSKVNDPSEADRRFEIPAPFFRPTGELRFK